MTGISSGSASSDTTEVMASASPPRAAAVVRGGSQSGQRSQPGGLDSQLRPRGLVSESTTRHSPPNSSICSSGWLNADRLVYCSGRLRPRISAAGGAHCGPTSRPARPPNATRASAPSTGLTSAAAGMPWIHQPAARKIARPGMNCGASPPPCAADPGPVTPNPALANVSPGWAPPNAASDGAMGSEPCWAIQ